MFWGGVFFGVLKPEQKPGALFAGILCAFLIYRKGGKKEENKKVEKRKIKETVRVKALISHYLLGVKYSHFLTRGERINSGNSS